MNKVTFNIHGDAWELAPLGRRDARLELWRSYSREEIPELFGLKFNRGAWNPGFVVQFGHVFLLVSLKKTGTGENSSTKTDSWHRTSSNGKARTEPRRRAPMDS